MNADVTSIQLPCALAGALAQNRRAMRLDFGPAATAAAQTLVPQYADIHQGICAGLEAQVVCLSERADLSRDELLGLPVSIQVATDGGALHAINGIVSDVHSGAFDGTLASYRLTIIDAMSLMRRRRNMRIFVGKSVPDILGILLAEWQQRSAILGQAFRFQLLLDRSRYPVRAQTLQLDESDSGFLDRLTRREGMFCFVVAGTPDGSDGDTPAHTLVFCDDPMKLPQAQAGAVPFHYGAAVKARDSVTRWGEAHSLVSGTIRGTSPDYETGRVDRVDVDTLLDLGKAGNDLARLMTDAAVDRAHAGDSRADYERQGRLRMQAHERRAAYVHAASDVRNLTPGSWFVLSGHPLVDKREPEQREFVVTRLRQRIANNFPKALDEQARALAEASGWHLEVRPGRDDVQIRYENTFTCVPRGAPLTPDYDPRIDLPRTDPMTAVVVGPNGQEVHCDELGRYKLQFVGLYAEDHAHAQGAGTSGTERDSAWVRAGNLWAGQRYGINLPLRAGMEVLVAFANGDPDRPYIATVLPGHNNMPAAFNDTGALPDNKHLSGIKTKEVDGSGFNQVAFDDTPGEISSQLASTHAASQLSLGYLTHPRDQGKAEPRGEGAAITTQAMASMHGNQGMLLSTERRSQAGNQMDRDGLLGLAQAFASVAAEFGKMAATHHAGTYDPAPLKQLIRQLQDWEHGTNTAPQGAGQGGTPLIALSSPAGIVAGSADNIALAAQTSVDVMSGDNTQVSAGKDALIYATNEVSIFAVEGGVRVVTAKSDVVVESHTGNIALNGAKRITLNAGEEIVLNAPKVRTVTQGAQTTWGGGEIVEEASGGYTIKSANFQQIGGGGAPAASNLPANDRHFDRHLRLTDQLTGEPIANRRYRATLADGQVVEGVSDAQGYAKHLKSSITFAHYSLEILD
ncbi:type VI secretion system Vgr family protein [Ralstonia pseudosolanacearum]|uniref:type VI secretion system Vgr family protein n=1 Tax=Ralstonia pseudosolanacearum TaxID=1310165 RepID=UPI0026763794|nr:type VI secretion system tip protein VgrG [Ralstonia pseudosolanacearum]MDO3527195.1 type VI secretion system tip protein VgrG [Ralstonia pseudosolanacearum]MDO3532628.1 type VI secretion system tip protein VgrG [Ralstonia pseudosolanacearum]